MKTDWWTKFNIGDRVRFTERHPWSGYTGVVVRYMDTLIGRVPVVKIDSGDWENWGRFSSILEPTDAVVDENGRVGI